MEPLMCPFCGGTNIIEVEESKIELDAGYWIIYHWACLDCHETFDKVVATPTGEIYEEDEHWS